MVQKYIILILFTCIFLISANGQTTTNRYGKIVVEITKERNKSNPKIEFKSVFFGDSIWLQSLEQRITKSLLIDKRMKKGVHIISVRFFIAKDGTVSEVVCETDPGFELCPKVRTIIMKSPKWYPANQIN